MAASNRPKRWVDKKIALLDGKDDSAEIVSLIANYKMNDFIMDLNYATGFMSNTVPSGGSDVIYGTGKAKERPQPRYLDTVKFFWMWYFEGPESPNVQASIKRLNGYHEALYKNWPKSFDQDEDFIFTLCNLMVGADRMRDRVGVKRQPRNVQLAWYYFWKDIAAQMTGMHGPLQGFPESYEEAYAFVEEFEARPRPYTDTGNKVAELMLEQYVDRFFPTKRKLGRQIVLTFVPDAVLKRHSLPKPNPVAKFAFRRVMQFLLFAQDNFAPDNKVPTSEALQSPEYTAWSTKVRREEADQVRAARAARRAAEQQQAA